MEECQLCKLELVPSQRIIFENESCLFLQLDEASEKGITLEGAGIIVPKNHRETVFDLTSQEWTDTFDLVKTAKAYIDQLHQPSGYNIGWNCGEVAGQHLFHAHLHILPRYENEKLNGKGIRHLFKQRNNRE